MSDVHERPQGANATDPSSPRPRWKPSDPARWAILGLADPGPAAELPDAAFVPDVLAWALVLPGAADPVEGIIDGVRAEVDALATTIPDRRVADVLTMLSRRLDAAIILLKWVDNRAPMPAEPHEEAEPMPVEPPEPPVDPEDIEVTRDAGPDVPRDG